MPIERVDPIPSRPPLASHASAHGGAVGSGAFLLGLAGLLPQALAVLAIAVGARPPLGPYVAMAYATIILSFLGGMWWGFAMHRWRRQGALVAVAVVPSLVGFGIVCGWICGLDYRWAMAGLGAALLLSLLVDRHLVARGDAPANWMRLRVPLSLGLGALTIAAGFLAR